MKRLTPADVAQQLFTKFNDLTAHMGNEERWEAADELCATMEGVTMERDELEASGGE